MKNKITEQLAKNIDYLFIVFIILISFVPLMPLTGWQGYGPAGEYTYTGEKIMLRYNDPTFGNDKPHVFIKDRGRTISLIELSDHQSTINDKNLYYGFSTKTRVVNGELKIFYESKNFSFIKIVKPLKNSIQVMFLSNNTINLTVTLWRWYYATIESFDRPVTRYIEPKNVISFSLFEGGRVYDAELRITPAPSSVSISGEMYGGLNKIVLNLKGEEIIMEVAVLASGKEGGLILLDIRGSNYLYPVLATIASVSYLWIRRLFFGK